ncbi:MAG: hypothetical protein B6D72_15080 [gamma proteobacterium symbiont of Ctena orbiculata]|uniref:DUF302 domain-containing protein n=1 Tax=Candidatus Thiodiazotropha taylori TaxID=2792791 RepID=A0A944M6B5_9GAMM|nr:DUF302 domain-containing protein [Candidatus Thiodiazotropha taylori]PUB86575.1 MAG: hypothetical protein DBP00_10675 [gamma proteobacterium symbiont of Ctena orbiculata]MBT2987928.1 DUF302 domain-containing protein [Candidatus Thiodiazotropha taylori]MBT2997573.1 DUF302 domain-containing protein [Candidatus Thiodiazotropha taylori]MBT2999001.1 DUF302 domain-containing protein [Candidatus Thiodiazotropha taylori]
MGMIKNLLALIGLLVVIAAAAVYVKHGDALKGWDPGAGDTFMEFTQLLATTKNAAEASVWKIPVAEDLTWEDVEETMKFVANEHNMANVGELPLYKDIEAKLGTEYRFVKIYLFCDSLIAAKMLDYSDAYSAYLPCRITLLEDHQGKLWLMALNMDMMIYGGKPLPPELKEQALQVKEYILDIMNRGASGEF